MHIFGESRGISRKLILIAGLTATALTLSACGGQSGVSASASPSATASASAEATPSETPTPTLLTDLESIEVSTDQSTAATITATYPFTVPETLIRTIVEGSGPVVTASNALVKVQYTGINASTGAEFDSSWSYGQPVTFPLDGVVTGFAKAIQGQKVGSRVLVAITPVDGYGTSGNTSAGIGGSDVLLFVIDILDAQLDGPSGETVTPPAGLPTVTETDGVPSISTAGVSEPSEVVVQPLVKGSGTAVADGATVRTKAVCVTWDGTEIYNDYAAGGADDDGSTTHQALWQALQGQQVGSRLLITVPGAQAYPNGNPKPTIAPNSAMACVVDILYVQTS